MVQWKPAADGRVDVFLDALYRVQLDPGHEFETPPGAEVWLQAGRVHEVVVPLVRRIPRVLRASFEARSVPPLTTRKKP